MSFTVYKSSAGSGKTYTLVKEYLKIALREKETKRYKNILAITFTNKAAAEMKERVIDALTAIASVDKLEGTAYFLLKDLVNELQQDEASIRSKCEAVLSSMLHNYSDIAISTIDKFVHKIVRSFAHDLHISLNFTVEMDTENLLQTAIDLMISKVGSDPHLTAALVDFSERKADEERSWNIEMDLADFAKDLLKEQHLTYLNKLKNLSLPEFSKIRKRLDELTSQFEVELQHIGAAGIHHINSNGIEQKDLAGGANGIGKYFFYLQERRAKNYQATPTLQKYVSNDNWTSAKVSPAGRDAINSCKDEMAKLYHAAQKIIEAGYAAYLLHVGIQKNIYAVSVLNELEKVIQEIKLQKNLVHISEFSKKIADIVSKEPVPFIYERIGEKYKNYLIDEFQDTSILQWQNFIPLVENSLATNEFNMLVGDAKQAIYRWRGGEVEQFAMLPEIFKSESNPIIQSRQAVLIRNFVEKKLVYNRRSKHEIIEFNNSFFRFVVDQERFPKELKSIYDALEQESDATNTGGSIHFHFLEPGAEDFNADALTANQVLQTLTKLLADNFQLSDIAILTRNNKVGVMLSRFLIEAGIPVVSRESLLLKTSSAVNFLVNTLHYLNDSQQEIAQAAMMDFLLKQNGAVNTVGLNDYFKTKDLFFTNLKGHYPEWNKSKLRRLPLYELCESLTRIFKLTAKADPYVVFFLDAVQAYTLANTNDALDFLEWWERKKHSLSIVIPQGLNAVNVLTIHKSKGLEFPVVLFPNANWNAKVPKENMWVNLEDPELPQLKAALLPLNAELAKTTYAADYQAEINRKELDDINLVYVAFTRAIKRLYVFAELPDGHKKIGKYYVEYLQAKGLWKDNQFDYALGTEQKNETKSKTGKGIGFESLTTLVSNDWRTKLVLSHQSEKLWNMENPDSDKDYGNLIHTALSKIKSLSDVDTSLQAMLTEGLIGTIERDFLQRKLSRLISRKEIQPFFETGLHIKTEAEILLPKGNSYRPDRVVIYPEKAVVLDYKTGVELEKHKEQINQYAETLLQMGFTSVEKYLLYTETEKLIII
ncbi:MAG: UvrD-helicase domain-containing protein [Bacteroidetes bacterium]|nr:UvrD-helicase domain-containing protein [Bacteroidota bacterium]